jgi:hypothetical protein
MMYRRASISVVFLAVLGLLLAGCGGGSGDSDGGDVPFSTAEWSTDFEEHSVSLDEFTSGGPPKDGIPAIDRPKFVSTAEADGFLAGRRDRARRHDARLSAPDPDLARDCQRRDRRPAGRGHLR